MAGLFISFEGGEGCGKSTQIRTLNESLQSAGHKVVQTREPGGTPLGEAIRNLLQHDDVGEGMSPEAELLLFTASRAQHARALIQPAIDAGQIVICDRYLDSTSVYQGVARQIDPASVDAINQFAIGQTLPDLTILIDLDPTVGMARVKARSGGKLDRMEQEAIEFFEAVRAGYLKAAAAEPKRFLVINGDQSVEAIQAEIWNAVEALLATGN